MSTVNPWLNTGYSEGRSTEQDLMEDLIVEAIQINGSTFYYIPLTEFSKDDFFNEDPNPKFENYYPIEMYVNNGSGWSGSGHLLGKFGLSIKQTVDLLVARKRFKKITGLDHPNEGDLIYFPLSKSLFELSLSLDEPMEVNQFYQLSKLYTWQLKCSLYEYSYETFTTGITELDTELDKDTYTTPFAKNVKIDDESENNALSFSESNPFGTLTDDDSN